MLVLMRLAPPLADTRCCANSWPGANLAPGLAGIDPGGRSCPLPASLGYLPTAVRAKIATPHPGTDIVSFSAVRGRHQTPGTPTLASLESQVPLPALGMARIFRLVRKRHDQATSGDEPPGFSGRRPPFAWRGLCGRPTLRVCASGSGLFDSVPAGSLRQICIEGPLAPSSGRP